MLMVADVIHDYSTHKTLLLANMFYSIKNFFIIREKQLQFLVPMHIRF